MIGKNSSLKNKIVIQLTPNYRIRIDCLNSTLLKKKTRNDNIDELIDDGDEIENGYSPLGYFSSADPEYLVRGLIIDHVVSTGSRNYLKMEEYTNSFNSCLKKLTKQIGNVTVNIDELYKTITGQEETIHKLEKTIRIMKGQVTKLKLKTKSGK